jgi:uncharacterized protein (TIGR02145 family)
MKNLIKITGVILISILIHSCKKTPIPIPETVTDIDGNVYNTVTIGTQVWMKENLKTIRYNDGTEIPNIKVNSSWFALTTGAYSDYDNNPSNSNIYGRLYNWYTVDNDAATRVASNGGKNVCPTGWHVPTRAEWTTLLNTLGGPFIAGGKLKEADTTHWLSPNTGATDESGFTALPGGLRCLGLSFIEIENSSYWWSSTPKYTTFAYHFILRFDEATVSGYSEWNKKNGLSVRCLWNN